MIVFIQNRTDHDTLLNGTRECKIIRALREFVPVEGKNKPCRIDPSALVPEELATFFVETSVEDDRAVGYKLLTSLILRLVFDSEIYALLSRQISKDWPTGRIGLSVVPPQELQFLWVWLGRVWGKCYRARVYVAFRAGFVRVAGERQGRRDRHNTHRLNTLSNSDVKVMGVLEKKRTNRR